MNWVQWKKIIEFEIRSPGLGLGLPWCQLCSCVTLYGSLSFCESPYFYLGILLSAMSNSGRSQSQIKKIRHRKLLLNCWVLNTEKLFLLFLHSFRNPFIDLTLIYLLDLTVVSILKCLTEKLILFNYALTWDLALQLQWVVPFGGDTYPIHWECV